MEHRVAKELEARLRREELRVAYFPHRYAAWLLARVAREGTPARALKASRHARLLDNGLVREVAARAPAGVLTRRALEQVAPHRVETYRIDFALWGTPSSREWREGWHQTSRPGVNLVLLLNFPLRHNATYRRRLDPEGVLPAVDGLHPHAPAPELTLAWARLDVDLASGEALIEEVQSDWIRRIQGVWSNGAKLSDASRRDRVVQLYFENERARFDDLERYWLRVLAHHRSWWAEATLFAALWLLVEQLQVRRVYYHTPEGGALRKRIRKRQPPRSLYTELPRRFGFELTSKPPALLRWSERWDRRVGAAAQPPWYRLMV
jgi:hypothetical protein